KNYGNGVYCNKHKCSVDWATFSANIANNSVAMAGLTGGNAGNK
nr:RecName: Full=Bacteriocin weissellin-A [Weissella paramesenteroides]